MFRAYSENVINMECKQSIVKTKIYLCTFTIIGDLEYISHPLNVHSYEGSILKYCNISGTVSFLVSGVANGLDHTCYPDLGSFFLISLYWISMLRP